jgi:hypothetical protein
VEDVAQAQNASHQQSMRHEAFIHHASPALARKEKLMLPIHTILAKGPMQGIRVVKKSLTYIGGHRLVDGSPPDFVF